MVFFLKAIRQSIGTEEILEINQGSCHCKVKETYYKTLDNKRVFPILSPYPIPVAM